MIISVTGRSREYDGATLAVIIPTRNRCPFGVEEYRRNPLVWCLYSLFQQEPSGLRQIIVISDGSTDHTEQVIRHVAARSPVEIVYTASPQRRGPCHSRNAGLELARARQVFFLDDDCILAPATLALAQHCHRQLTASHGVRAGALHLPVFLRSDDYESCISAARIGRVYPRSGQVHANLRCFPAEFGTLRADPSAVLCLPVDFFHEVFLIDTALLRGAGGFRDAGFAAIQHESMLLSLRLTGSGLTHFQLLHPGCHAIHFRYGSPHPPAAPRTRHPGLWIDGQRITLETMLGEAMTERGDTGGRAPPADIIRDVIAGRYAQLLSLNTRGARRWARIAFDALVNGRDDAGLCRFPPLPHDRAARIGLWRSALALGREVYDRELA